MRLVPLRSRSFQRQRPGPETSSTGLQFSLRFFIYLSFLSLSLSLSLSHFFFFFFFVVTWSVAAVTWPVSLDSHWFLVFTIFLFLNELGWEFWQITCCFPCLTVKVLFVCFACLAIFPNLLKNKWTWLNRQWPTNLFLRSSALNIQSVASRWRLIEVQPKMRKMNFVEEIPNQKKMQKKNSTEKMFQNEFWPSKFHQWTKEQMNKYNFDFKWKYGKWTLLKKLQIRRKCKKNQLWRCFKMSFDLFKFHQWTDEQMNRWTNIIWTRNENAKNELCWRNSKWIENAKKINLKDVSKWVLTFFSFTDEDTGRKWRWAREMRPGIGAVSRLPSKDVELSERGTSAWFYWPLSDLFMTDDTFFLVFFFFMLNVFLNELENGAAPSFIFHRDL